MAGGVDHSYSMRACLIPTPTHPRVDIHGMEGVMNRTVPASEPSGHLLVSDSVWTRRCACCYLFITTSDDINIIQPADSTKALQKHTVHEMLSKIFLLPKNIMVEEELKYCSKCSLLIHKGFQWFQALKRVVYKETKIHTLLKTLQEHNLKIKKTSLCQTAKYHLKPATPVCTTATTPVPEPNTLHLNTIRIPEQTPWCSVSEVPVSLPLLNGVMPATPTPTPASVSIKTQTLRVQKPDPCQTSSDNPETVSPSTTLPQGPTTMRMNKIWILRRNSKVRTASSDTTAHSFEHETNFVAPSVLREQILSNKDNKKTGANRKGKAVVIPNTVEIDPLALEIESTDGSPPDETPRASGELETVALPTNPTADDSITNCKVISSAQGALGSSPPEQHKERLDLDPYFASCKFCAGRIYGKDPNSTRQLSIMHYEEKHSAQDIIPAPTVETVIVYSTGTKVFSSRCRVCPVRFYSKKQGVPKTELQAHRVAKHHSSLQCPLCPTMLKGNQGPKYLQSRLRKHIEIQHERKSKHICEICERPMESRCAIKGHMMSHMNQEERNAVIEKTPGLRKSCLCPICGVLLRSMKGNEEQLLRSHICRVHTKSVSSQRVEGKTELGSPNNTKSKANARKSKHICRICEKPMSSVREIKVHMMSHMNKEERNAEVEKNPSLRKHCLCPICGVVLRSLRTSVEQLLKIHIRNVHSEKKPTRRFSCGKCDFSTVVKRILSEHQLVHVDGAYCKFTCKRCGKGYVACQGREYKDHIMVCCDERERPVQCPEPDCFKRFKHKHAVMIHLMGLHKKTPEQAREIVYPGLPMHDWIRNLKPGIKNEKKRQMKRKNETQEVDVTEIGMELPVCQVEMETRPRSMLNRNKIRRLVPGNTN